MVIFLTRQAVCLNFGESGFFLKCLECINRDLLNSHGIKSIDRYGAGICRSRVM